VNLFYIGSDYFWCSSSSKVSETLSREITPQWRWSNHDGVCVYYRNIKTCAKRFFSTFERNAIIQWPFKCFVWNFTQLCENSFPTTSYRWTKGRFAKTLFWTPCSKHKIKQFITFPYIWYPNPYELTVSICLILKWKSNCWNFESCTPLRIGI